MGLRQYALFMNLSEQAGLIIITIRLGEAEGEAHDVDSLLPGASIALVG